MAKPLIILESPNKVKTVKKFLGDEFNLLASAGHIKDLPKKSLGIDIEHDFKPKYVTIPGKQSIVEAIRKEGAAASAVYLATDPDREGEAIAWHLAELIRAANPNQIIYRIGAREINEREFREQLSHPGQLNADMYDSQQTRRILDRLVGYQISPILWDKVKRGLSAGRVQSVAVRLIVDRENEIRAHKALEYWEIFARLSAASKAEVVAELVSDDGRTIYQDSASVDKHHPNGVICNEVQAQEIVDRSKSAPFIVREIARKSTSTKPEPPLRTSDLYKKASSQYRMSSDRTAKIGQELFEGGFITYHRTDSFRVSDEALAMCRDYIATAFGRDYLPASPVHYDGSAKKGKKAAAPVQDAHEAIRPTDVKQTPDALRPQLTPDQYKIYSLIWKCFVASQMKPSVNDVTTVHIDNGKLAYRVTGSTPKFDGFRRVTGVRADAVILPELHPGEELACIDVTKNQKMTAPPKRYTEASFIQFLTDEGIGRPSTYATIVKSIQDKGYVENQNRELKPTDLGEIVTRLLVENFQDIVDVRYTARMETKLDEIADGNLGWIQALADFYKPFEKELESASQNMRNVKGDVEKTNLKCEKCGGDMVIRWGKHGHFLTCEKYPDCKNSCEFRRREDGTIERIEKVVEKRGTCPKCGADMIVRNGRYGTFLACSNYPKCKHTENISLGIKCPKCGADVVQKTTRSKKVFFGCSRYPECDYSTWNQPTSQKCPECGERNLEIVRRGQKQSYLCPGCSYSAPVETDQP